MSVTKTEMYVLPVLDLLIEEKANPSFAFIELLSNHIAIKSVLMPTFRPHV